MDRNEKIWAAVNTGKKVHAFVQSAPHHPGYLRAMCRENYRTPEMALFRGQDDLYSAPCARCLTLAEAMWDRAEASMAPVDTVENPTASQDYYAERGMDLVIARDEADAIRIRAERQAERRMNALHAEALAMDAETAQPVNPGPAVETAEPLKVGEWAVCADCNECKIVAHLNYQDVPFCAGCIALHGQDDPVETVTMSQPADGMINGWVHTIDGRMIGFRSGQDPVIVSTDGIITDADGVLNGSMKAMRRVYEAGAAVMGEDGELRWAS